MMRVATVVYGLSLAILLIGSAIDGNVLLLVLLAVGGTQMLRSLLRDLRRMRREHREHLASVASALNACRIQRSEATGPSSA
ncbi:hypothetical protein [Streptomyces sp. ODS28]|uniref:hypothetical protein n=1 Tax=Streptomyces sp. ODS28 TaxID=3136688 RepID=UPI0031F0EAA5